MPDTWFIGSGGTLPDALDRKLPHASTEWAWFWAFPSQALAVDPETQIVRRWHASDTQELLGHANVETTMIYLHVARGLRAPPRSPFDQL